tara:strand:+ start:887 stop:1351 length:465 start_codon:yes stop_codon:yes gene_type:complete
MMVKLPVLYSQLAIFSADMAKPYNDWSDGHVVQGFSWRRNSVSFAVPSDISDIDVTIREVSKLKAEHGADRVIVVPLEIGGGRGAEFGNVVETTPVLLADGKYSVCFELFLDAGRSSGRAEISITPGECDAAILVADAGIRIPSVLLMDAEAAR